MAHVGPEHKVSWLKAIARKLHCQTDDQQNEPKPLIAEVAFDFPKQRLDRMLNAIHIRLHASDRTLRLPCTVDEITSTSDFNEDADLIQPPCAIRCHSSSFVDSERRE
jgi:hypothetical protein